jgi:hypothetical protein
MTPGKKKKQEGINLKKYMALILGVLFVLSFAASAFAIHAEIPAETQSVVAVGTTQITLGGEIRTRGWFKDNLSSDALGVDTKPLAWWDQRVRLSVDAVVAPGVEGYVQLETHSSSSGDKYVWGTGGTLCGKDSTGAPVCFGKNSSGVGGTNAKPGTYIDVLQSWIQYSGSGLFSFPAGFKIGHMPLKLSYGQFFDNTQYGDDALVLFMDPIKGLHVAALTFKGSEGATADNTDDLDAYVGLVTFKWNETNTVGSNYTYINSSDPRLKLQNLSLHADGSVAGLGYKVAGDVQFGSVGDDDRSFDDKVRFRGYAVSAAVNYNINPVNIRGSVAMGSGEGDDDDDKIKEFIPFVGNIQNYSFIYEYQHRTTAFTNAAAPSDGYAAGIANTTYFNVGVDFKATQDVTLSSDAYLFRATKVDAFEDVLGDNDISKNAGWEVDGKVKYALAKNLTYQIDAGYFKPGTFYEDVYNVDTKGVIALRHSLTLSF